MTHLRRTDDEPLDALLQSAIGIRYTRVLAQMLEPRLDQKHLEEAVGLGQTRLALNGAAFS